jgi:hypothetical protein
MNMIDGRPQVLSLLDKRLCKHSTRVWVIKKPLFDSGSQSTILSVVELQMPSDARHFHEAVH